MIWTVYPVPFLRQFQLRLELATRRTRRAFDQRRRSSRNGGSEFSEDLQSVYDTLHARLTAYHEFERRFDRLVSLLCIAAQEGVTVEREAAFQQERLWFVAEYTRFRTYLGAFLSPDPADRARGWWRSRPCDAFEALFLPRDMQSLLEDTNMIPRLNRAQDAVTAWYNSLRQAERTLSRRF